MARRKWSWTSLQEERAAQVLQVVEDLKSYWPLTLRQIYYQLVAKGQIENTRSRYNMLSKLVKWMRIDERLPWRVLEDRSRTITGKRGYEDIEDFIESEKYYFLDGYARCLVQGQDKYVEVWTEKDALLGIFREVVLPYCMRAVVCRGYQSITFIADFYKRAEQAIMKGQEPVVLYFGDLDPSGVQMLEATIETLQDELDLWGVNFKRIALHPEHIAAYNLPNDPTAIKTSDPRYRKYYEKYGDIAVELDALHPADLKDLTRKAIEAEIDMDQFNDQETQEAEDIEEVEVFRERVINAIDEIQEQMFDL